MHGQDLECDALGTPCSPLLVAPYILSGCGNAVINPVSSEAERSEQQLRLINGVYGGVSIAIKKEAAYASGVWARARFFINFLMVCF